MAVYTSVYFYSYFYLGFSQQLLSWVSLRSILLLIIANMHEVPTLQMTLHPVQTSHKVLKAQLRNQPEAVVPSAEVIHHGALILALLSTPKAKG